MPGRPAHHAGESGQRQAHPDDRQRSLPLLERGRLCGCGGGFALAGLLDNAAEVFDTQFHLAQDDGNWAGGYFADFVAFSGLKAWVATVFYQLNQDQDFLADLYPYMLNDARWHAKRREQQRRMAPDGRRIRGYGLIQPTMHDCGMNDATGTGVFIPHNTWAVYADKVALETARLLGKTPDVVELEAIYQAGRDDLLAAIEQGAIDENGYRWIPSSPNDPSGSFWGALNTAQPCGLLALNAPLIEGTIAKMESFQGEGGLTRFTGWQKEGLWIAVVLDNLGMVYLARGEADKFARQLYAAVNHASLLNTWPEERDRARGPPRSRAIGSTSGPRVRSSQPCERPSYTNAATLCASAWACRGNGWPREKPSALPVPRPHSDGPRSSCITTGKPTSSKDPCPFPRIVTRANCGSISACPAR